MTVIFVSILANAGGIGGGALLTPIYIWLFDFTVEDAIPLSKMTIFMGAIVNYLILKNARLEDDPNRPLINYSLAGIIVPMLLAGTSVGVFGAKIFPPILILCFLSGFLVLSTFKMFAKAFKMWKQETLENNVERTEITYSQNKAAFLSKEKNVFSESSSSISYKKQPEKYAFNKSVHFYSDQGVKSLKMKNQSRRDREISDRRISSIQRNISLETPQMKIKKNGLVFNSVQDSEESGMRNSKSLMTNPFWNNTDSVDKNGKSQKVNKEICSNTISKFKYNPGTAFTD